MKFSNLDFPLINQEPEEEVEPPEVVRRESVLPASYYCFMIDVSLLVFRFLLQVRFMNLCMKKLSMPCTYPWNAASLLSYFFREDVTFPEIVGEFEDMQQQVILISCLCVLEWYFGSSWINRKSTSPNDFQTFFLVQTSGIWRRVKFLDFSKKNSSSLANRLRLIICLRIFPEEMQHSVSSKYCNWRLGIMSKSSKSMPMKISR